MRSLTDFELTRFETLVSLTQDQLKSVLALWLKKYYAEDIMITDKFLYGKGDIPIALVAHMDTVFKTPPTKDEIFYDKKKNVIWSPAGLGADDRAGVFAILSIVGSGLRPHVIFTTDEEIGAIGAEELSKMPCPFKDLRYLIQLDRRGHDDCVFYDCDNKNFTTYVESFGFIENWGSFSDISMLCPAWKIAGVNLSIGYFNEHSTIEHLNTSILLSTISKVKKMLKANDIPKFEYIPAPVYGRRSWNFRHGVQCVCTGCGKTFDTDDCYDVKMLDGSLKFFCQDCAFEPNNRITWCNKCYEAFEYEEDCGAVPFMCLDCEYDIAGGCEQYDKYY